MDLETACHDLKEPGIIDEKVLYNAIIEQGPKGEEGKLFKQQGIVYEEVKYLRLEFLDILKIDHLWMMTGLTKLQLCNNSIEKIENLDPLVNLRELDLSFNKIEIIENLEPLLELEVLTLFENRIEVLENLSHLTKLTIFSVGNNKITNKDGVFYLRGFESLKSFNMAGNPVCQEENFNKFVLAYMPQLVYYEYRKITDAEREEAREFFLKELSKLERDEAEVKEARRAIIEEEKKEVLNTEAFVEYLGGCQLFDSMFEKDLDCQSLLKMGDYVMNLYNEYPFIRKTKEVVGQNQQGLQFTKLVFLKKIVSFKKNFTEVTKELHLFGLEQLELRKVEIARFEKYIGEAKEKIFKESRDLVEDFLDQKKTFFSQIQEALNTEEDDEDTANEVSLTVQVVNEAFKDLYHRTWTILMKKEVYLFEAMEEVNGTYERAMTELCNQFIEGSQAQFALLRQFQNGFNESLMDAANKFFTNYTVATATGNEMSNLPKDLLNLMQDKDYLTNALSASHDYHLLVIDQREDKLISGIKNWLSNLVANLINSEINRNRAAITEINHFLDSQKLELHELLTTPVGLTLLPKEIQDVLHI